MEIDYKEALDGALEVIFELKKKEKAHRELVEYMGREFRSRIRHGIPLSKRDPADTDLETVYYHINSILHT